MKTKQKGSTAERELIALFWNTGTWAAMRAAGSGSSRHPSPDIIASNGERRLAIECKSVGGDTIRVEKPQFQDLQTFAQLFGAEVWIAARYSKQLTKDSHGEGWYFLSAEDLHETEKGYTMTQEQATFKGLSFSELIRKQ